MPARLRFGVLVMVALLASCGGGGGGGSALPPTTSQTGHTPTPGPTASTTPAPSGSPTSSPTPTAHPSSSPTASPTPTAHPTSSPTPTPAPTHSPTPTPSPSPTPPGPGISLLPDTTGRFGLIQVLDAYFTGTPPMTTNEIASEAPIYDSVWGAFQEPTWRGSSSNVILSYYDTMPEDNKLISAHDLTWWQANHPDWIMYACDSNGNPTRDLAWDGTNFGNVPLAFWLPEVQAYQMQLLVPYMLSNGYNALAVDQSGLHNIIVGGNPNFGQTPNNSEYGCGTYDSSGTFHQRYGTPGTAYNRKDPQYQSDVLAWLSSSVSTLHAQNLKLIANHAVITTPSDPGEAQFIADIDGMLNEYGYTHDGQYLNGPNFSLLLSWDEALQASGKAMLVSDYLCMGSPSCSNDPATISAEQADFALSSYAIGNEGGEDLYLSPHGGSVYSYRPELSTRYGASCGPYQQVSSYVYVRRFQNGLAIVNTSTSTYTYTLPAHTYTDIENRSFSNPISVAPEDGYMLLTSGNGCS